MVHVSYMYLFMWDQIFLSSKKFCGNLFFAVLEGQISNYSIFYLVHILCSCTHQYECEDGFLGPRDGCWSDTGSEAVPGQIFAGIHFHGMGFIFKYNENLYIAKYGMMTGC